MVKVSCVFSDSVQTEDIYKFNSLEICSHDNKSNVHSSIPCKIQLESL